MWSVSLVLLALTSDPIALLHRDGTKPSSPLFLTRHASLPGSDATELLTTANASFTHYYTAKGKHPLSRICAIDLDGDGADEIATSFSNAAKADEIRIVRAPSALGEKKPKVLASTSISDPALAVLGDGVEAIGRFSRSGAGKDELVLVRRSTDGSQRIEIRMPPSGKKKFLSPTQLVLDLGKVATDGEVIDAFGLDIDDIAGDELLVARTLNGASSLSVYTMKIDPTLVATKLSGAVELPADVLSVAPTRIGTGPAAGILLLRATSEGPRIETRTLSSALILGAPVLTAASPYHDVSLAAAIATRLAPLPPPDDSGNGPGGSIGEAWEIGVGLGTTTIATLQVKMIQLQMGWRFVDATGASIDVTIVPVGGEIDWFAATIAPATFSFRLKPKNSPLDTFATLNVTNPNGKGTGGMTTSPYSIDYSATSGSLGTLYLPAIGGWKSIDWIGFKKVK